MTPPPVDRTGTLMVRLWAEPGHTTSMRARITQTLDSNAKPRIAIAASADDICAIVRGWVEEVVASAPDLDAVTTADSEGGDAAVTPR
jgi:hypothetical protein